MKVTIQLLNALSFKMPHFVRFVHVIRLYNKRERNIRYIFGIWVDITEKNLDQQSKMDFVQSGSLTCKTYYFCNIQYNIL